MFPQSPLLLLFQVYITQFPLLLFLFISISILPLPLALLFFLLTLPLSFALFCSPLLYFCRPWLSVVVSDYSAHDISDQNMSMAAAWAGMCAPKSAQFVLLSKDHFVFNLKNQLEAVCKRHVVLADPSKGKLRCLTSC